MYVTMLTMMDRTSFSGLPLLLTIAVMMDQGNMRNEKIRIIFILLKR